MMQMETTETVAPGWYSEPGRPWIAYRWDGQRWTGERCRSGRVRTAAKPVFRPSARDRVEPSDLRPVGLTVPKGILPLLVGAVALAVLVPALYDGVDRLARGVPFRRLCPLP